MWTDLAPIIGLVGVIVGAVLVNWLTYSRSTKEKLWDLRRQSYGVILSELAAIDRICRAAEEYMAVHSADSYFDVNDSDTPFGRDLSNIGKHMKAVRDRFSDDYLIFSDDFVRTFWAAAGLADTSLS
jgi:hypothetical protein